MLDNSQNTPYLLATSHAALPQRYIQFIFDSPAVTPHIQLKQHTFFSTHMLDAVLT